ncbi:hypothetical protein AB9F45_37630, partial [Rhizobium leguminosarum]
IRPVDPNELVARSLTQIRRKRYNDRLRASVKQTIEQLHVGRNIVNHQYSRSHQRLSDESGIAQIGLDRLDEFRNRDRLGNIGL